MNESVIIAVVSAISAIAVAVVEKRAAGDRKKAQEDRDKAEQDRAEAKRVAELRAEESVLAMDMMSATLKLSVVSANALTGGHNNGNVQKAKSAAEEAQAKYDKFKSCLASEALYAAKRR